MRSFDYARATSVSDALSLLNAPGTMLLAGGTELLNWARIGIARPQRLVDIAHMSELNEIQSLPGGGIRIGALGKLNYVAQDPLIVSRYPVLSQSILKAASAQIRNLATIGGNPLQRVRCPYFRAEEPTPCNKRQPGSGCAALHGINDKHAIFGWTEDCVAVQPSDPAVALAALDALILTVSKEGTRKIPARHFHVLPSKDPAAHSILRDDEIITGIELGSPAPKSAYLKIRERESYEFATVSAAVTLDMDGDVIRQARIALGSVAMRPWRLEETERLLRGHQADSPAVIEAVRAGFSNARALSMNGYKIPLAQNVTRRTIQLAAEA